MDRRHTWIGVGLVAALTAASASAVAHAAPGKTVGSCSEAVVVERHYGEPHASASGRGEGEIYLSLSDGQHLEGPADLGTTGFFWDYTPCPLYTSDAADEYRGFSPGAPTIT